MSQHRDKRARVDTSPPVLRGAGCPHPTKQAYATKARAKRSLGRMTGVRGRETLAPYRCLCGTWHLGHKPGSRKSRPLPSVAT